jgi:hypothetical protein
LGNAISNHGRPEDIVYSPWPGKLLGHDAQVFKVRPLRTNKFLGHLSNRFNIMNSLHDSTSGGFIFPSKVVPGGVAISSIIAIETETSSTLTSANFLCTSTLLYVSG